MGGRSVSKGVPTRAPFIFFSLHLFPFPSPSSNSPSGSPLAREVLTPGRVRAQVAQGENAEASQAWGCARSRAVTEQLLFAGQRECLVCLKHPVWGQLCRAPPSIPRQAAREPRLRPAWQGVPSPRHVRSPVTHTRLHVMHALGQRLSQGSGPTAPASLGF